MPYDRNMDESTEAREALDAELGRRVAILLWDQKVSQTELSGKLGIDQSALSKKLRGARPWSAREVAVVARELRTTVGYLYGEEAAR